MHYELRKLHYELRKLISKKPKYQHVTMSFFLVILIASVYLNIIILAGSMTNFRPF